MSNLEVFSKFCLNVGSFVQEFEWKYSGWTGLEKFRDLLEEFDTNDVLYSFTKKFIILNCGNISPNRVTISTRVGCQYGHHYACYIHVTKWFSFNQISGIHFFTKNLYLPTESDLYRYITQTYLDHGGYCNPLRKINIIQLTHRDVNLVVTRHRTSQNLN